MAANKKSKNEFVGKWHIYEMELWDEDYLNMEVPAYIEIDSRDMGQFQFGLVSGHLDGEVVEEGARTKFEFTWDGNDECDAAQGSGWAVLKDANTMKGRIKIHLGDSSSFLAKRTKN